MAMANSPAAKVTRKDFGLKRIMKELDALNGSYTLVGIQSTAKSKRQRKNGRVRDAGESIAQIAAANEFGTRKIPPRPFIRPMVLENREKINKYSEIQLMQMYMGKRTAREAIGRIGELGQNLTIEKLDSVYNPPNSPITVAIKGSSKPLVDTGQMRAAIKYVVVMSKQGNSP